MKLASAPARLAGYLSAALLAATACGGSAETPSGAMSGSGGASGASPASGGATTAFAGMPMSAGSATAGAATAGNHGDGKTPCYGGCAAHPERPKPGAPPECPLREPEAGAGCGQESIRCSYGDSRAVQCRHLYECTDGAWQPDTTVSQRYSCDPLPADYCPAAPQHEQPCTIANVGMPCSYGELSCACFASSPAPGKPGNWLCYGPPADPKCPAFAPNLGEGCSSNGLACDYDADACTAAPTSSLFCFDGAWEQGQGYNCAL